MRTHFVKMEVALNRFSNLLSHRVMWLLRLGVRLQVQVCLEPRIPVLILFKKYLFIFLSLLFI